MNFVANIPFIKCFIRKEYLYDLKKDHGELEECVLVAVKSLQNRALLFEAYMPNYGACYDKLPLNAFVWRQDFKTEELLSLQELEMWDGFSNDICVWSKQLLKYCNVKIWINKKGFIKGQYLFSIDSAHTDANTLNTSTSEVPSEHKQHNFGKLENGQFFAQPNNRMIWLEQSLTPKALKKPDFEVSTHYFFSETENKWNDQEQPPLKEHT